VAWVASEDVNVARDLCGLLSLISHHAFWVPGLRPRGSSSTRALPSTPPARACIFHVGRGQTLALCVQGGITYRIWTMGGHDLCFATAASSP
jgi:hypothetical protein